MSGKCLPNSRTWLFSRLHEARTRGDSFLDWQLDATPALRDDAEDALLQLLEALRNAPMFQRDVVAHELLLRIHFGLPTGTIPSALQWIHNQETAQRWFWQDREGKEQWAGVGCADSVHIAPGENAESAFHRLQTRLKTFAMDANQQTEPGAAPVEEIRYFGGMRFAPQGEMASHWQTFGHASFHLPLIQLRQQCQTGTTRIALHIHFKRGQSIAEAASNAKQAWQSLCWQNKKRHGLAPLHDATITPNEEGWFANIAHAKKAFAQTELDKVVLATEHEYPLPCKGEPRDWTSWLAALADRTEDTYVFYFQPDAEHAFFGATPERLYTRKDRTINSEALAGTLPRGNDEQEDARLGLALLDSSKDRREQAIVTEAIGHQLAEYCETVATPPAPSLRKLRHVQHLWTPLQGQLKNDVSDLDLLQGLHPTPAVGGRPREQALATIASLENFDRGWYAAPIGWLSASSATFAVAIRSALMTTTKARLFVGAGIVPDSQPDKEWAELGYKLRPFHKLSES